MTCRRKKNLMESAQVQSRNRESTMTNGHLVRFENNRGDLLQFKGILFIVVFLSVIVEHPEYLQQ
jgi:hypothetical protein